MEKLGARDFFSALHRVMGSKSTEVCGIRNLEGEIVNNGSEVRETWKEFFENLGRDGVNEGQFDEEFRVLLDAKVRQMEVDSGDVYQVELDYPISVSEVSEQLKLLNNWKAGGPDGLRNELLKICDSVDGVEMLVVLLNKIWGDEAMPDELAVGRIVTLFKGGDVHDCGDYRGISLLNVVYKLLSAILNKRLVRYCDENGVLDEEQGGFRQGRGCTDQIYSLHTVVAERKGRGVDSYMCFIDVKKAYDRIWRNGLWMCLADNGVKGKMWRVLRAMYSHTKSSVLYDGVDSDLFEVELGVRQGDVISPLLFSIFFNGLIRALKAKGVGVHMVNRILCSICGYSSEI
jgi:hypothetical protein